jgi:hypothetical protein
MRPLGLVALTIALVCGLIVPAAAAEVVDVGSRVELFVDDGLVERLGGDAEFQWHRPEPKEVVLVTDRPWEGNTCAYYTIFRDGDLFRMYYRGSHFDTEQRRAAHREVTCYAESHDGIHWHKPDLGLFEFDGSKANNIVWDGLGTHNFTPLKDGNPACADQARYKAVGRGSAGGRSGLFAFQSPDAIHWTLMHEEPVITEGAFDSQNLAFWDGSRGEYRAYWRIFKNGVRDIRTATSQDFLQWNPWTDLEYGDAPSEHLYTNAILPYRRAPHLFLGFPTRYLPATQQVEPILMASRDGQRWQRWKEALIPLDAPEQRDGNRSNYLAWGLVSLPEAPGELSVYASEAYYTGPDSRLRRFVYRLDGFVSLRSSSEGGDLLTKPICFAGDRLVLNFTTSEAGSVQAEIQDCDGRAIDGFALADSIALAGDAIEQPVAWKSGGDVSALAGRPIRLRLVLRNADVFSFRFQEQRSTND